MSVAIGNADIKLDDVGRDLDDIIVGIFRRRCWDRPLRAGRRRSYQDRYNDIQRSLHCLKVSERRKFLGIILPILRNRQTESLFYSHDAGLTKRI